MLMCLGIVNIYGLKSIMEITYGWLWLIILMVALINLAKYSRNDF